MSTQRPRRPTAWEVTFPDEVIEVDDDDKGDEGEELGLEGVEDDDMPVLMGKRKRRSNVDDRPAKRHSREPSLRHRESGDEKDREDTDDLLYYAPRQDELPESTPDIGFLLGESEVSLSPTTADAEEEKPVRLLRDWAVFDARPSKAKDAGAPTPDVRRRARVMRHRILRMRRMQDRKTMAIMVMMTVPATKRRGPQC